EARFEGTRVPAARHELAGSGADQILELDHETRHLAERRREERVSARRPEPHAEHGVASRLYGHYRPELLAAEPRRRELRGATGRDEVEAVAAEVQEELDHPVRIVPVVVVGRRAFGLPDELDQAREPGRSPFPVGPAAARRVVA